VHIPEGISAPRLAHSRRGVVPFWATAGRRVARSQVALRALCRARASFSFIVMMLTFPCPTARRHTVSPHPDRILLGPWAALISVSVALSSALFSATAAFWRLAPLFQHGPYCRSSIRGVPLVSRNMTLTNPPGQSRWHAAMSPQRRALCAAVEFGIQPTCQGGGWRTSTRHFIFRRHSGRGTRPPHGCGLAEFALTFGVTPTCSAPRPGSRINHPSSSRRRDTRPPSARLAAGRSSAWRAGGADAAWAARSRWSVRRRHTGNLDLGKYT